MRGDAGMHRQLRSGLETANPAIWESGFAGGFVNTAKAGGGGFAVGGGERPAKHTSTNHGLAYGHVVVGAHEHQTLHTRAPSNRAK